MKPTKLNYHSQKLTQTGIENLSARPETAKLLKGNKEENSLLNTGLGNDFLDMTRKVQTT